MMKKLVSVLCIACLGIGMALAQSVKKVGTEAFSLSYDPGLWQEMPMELSTGQIPEYYYLTLLRLDGQGMLMVLSHAVENGQSLQDYAELSLSTNSIFAQSGSVPVPVEIYGRDALYSTFTNGSSAGGVWFFSENGRFITFLTLDKDGKTPGLDILKTLQVHPLGGEDAEITEEKMISIFKSLQEVLASREPDRTPSALTTISVEIDPAQKILYETILYNITDPAQIAWLRQYLSDTATFSQETYPLLSRYEKRAVDLGYTLRLKYLDASEALIGVGIVKP